MKRVLIALAMLGASVFVAAPAMAQEDAAGSTDPGTSTESTTEATTPPPAEDPPVPEDVPESSPAAETPGTDNQGTEPEAEAQTPAADDVAALAVEEVTICHARSAESNPYGPQAITVSVQSIVNPNGHATHTGPVFPAADWGDIIPPFEHEDGSFPGLNWDADGQEFWFNNCQIPGDPPPPGEEEITICHATASEQNPYQQISPSVNSIVNPNGHGTHTGPVFFPGIAEQWGDIIPPFDYGDNESFPGLNWDTDGQAIYFNDCVFTDPPDEDDDDGGDDGDGGDDDGDDDKTLPNTGGDSPWILLTGGLLTVLGIAMLNSTPSMSGMHVAARGRHVKL